MSAYHEYDAVLGGEETYNEWLARQRRDHPRGFWALSKHRIERLGLQFVVFQRNRYVGRGSYLAALRMAQEDGAE